MAAAGRVTAQAKINLFLRVFGRGADGYHQLETLFQRLTLGDEVTVRVIGGARTLDCRGADVGPIEQNLAWRAAAAYSAAAGWPGGWAIEIDKLIPAGGGLGGGSADAGAVLRILDRLNPAPIGAAGLLPLALALGADVPFLTSSAPLALAWGRGERMLQLPSLPSRAVTLLLPPFGVPTADAFRWLAASRGADGAGSAAPRSYPVDAFADWGSVAALAANDLEAVVTARHPSLARALDEGQLAGWLTRMTGSGSTLFRLAGASGPIEWRSAAPPEFRTVETRTAVRVEDVALIE